MRRASGAIAAILARADVVPRHCPVAGLWIRLLASALGMAMIPRETLI
jgi:hypothetical protein